MMSMERCSRDASLLQVSCKASSKVVKVVQQVYLQGSQPKMTTAELTEFSAMNPFLMNTDLFEICVVRGLAIQKNFIGLNS